MLDRLLQNFTERLRKRIQVWAKRRSGDDAEPLTLVQRRIYILPTRAGLMFGVILFAMMLGAMNYSNSLAFMLTFALASLGFVAMHHVHRNLLELVVRRGRADHVFAGGEAIFNIVIENPSGTDRYDIQLEFEEQVHAIADVPSRRICGYRFPYAGEEARTTSPGSLRPVQQLSARLVPYLDLDLHPAGMRRLPGTYERSPAGTTAGTDS